MPYYFIQPWGRDKFRDATVVGIHETLDAAEAQPRMT